MCSCGSPLTDVYKGRVVHSWTVGSPNVWSNTFILPSQQQLRFNKVQLACLSISNNGSPVVVNPAPLFVQVQEIAPLAVTLFEGFRKGNIVGGVDTHNQFYNFTSNEPMAKGVMVKDPGQEDTIRGSLTFSILGANGLPPISTVTSTTTVVVVLDFYTASFSSSSMN